MTVVKDSARAAAQAQRAEEATSAWNDYLGERDAIVKRTAELKALRLEAEAKAARAARRKKKV